MITVHRAINGISINGTETLLDENNDVMMFDSIEEATEFLIRHGYSQEMIDDDIIFKEEDE